VPCSFISTVEQLWVTTLYLLVNIYGRFGRACCFHLQGSPFVFD